MRLCISFHYPIFIFFGYTLESGIAEFTWQFFFFFLIFGGIIILVSISCTNLHFHQVYKCSLMTEFSQTIVFLLVMMSAVIRCVRWNLIMVLLCTSLTLVMVSIVLYTRWPLGCLLWKNVYLIPIVIHFQIEVRKKW